MVLQKLIVEILHGPQVMEELNCSQHLGKELVYIMILYNVHIILIV